ncbi:hypothetical protein EV189_1402 [Motilibacter rhizosphaerae]|uniref:Putative membrane protein insertion efficiency factor n=1 Tax=Motilibacter rhizosphaerae TaxID=598652 RepID=A0A4Q7NRD7_9ACTN|nr:membrane protein insertion efficiency factor YidD [Motilibacter rhizosphaerae]RZS89633.1 hypothetical protein EV189_1402 [Motilibacter rhizosphaerae]
MGHQTAMVWSNGGRRRSGRYGQGGYGQGWGGGGYGQGPFGGGPFGGGGGGYYGRRGGGGGGGGCLRDLLLLDAGCCLAESLGCGGNLLLVAPRLLRAQRASREGTWALRLVRAYRTQVSPRRARPCCRMEPSCSAYAEEALLRHGTRRGTVLAARRLLRCRPGGPRGLDPVPDA